MKSKRETINLVDLEIEDSDEESGCCYLSVEDWVGMSFVHTTLSEEDVDWLIETLQKFRPT